MVAVRHLEFAGRVLGPPTMTTWWSLSLCSSFDNMNLSIFCLFDFKTLIQARKIEGLGNFTPKMGVLSTKLPKGTPLRESASF